MIILRNKQYSSNQILNTNAGSQFGFIKGRKYDTDLDRLGRMKTSHRELSRIGDIGKEVRNTNSMMSRGININDLKE